VNIALKKWLSEVLRGLTVQSASLSPSASLLDAISALRTNNYQIVLVGEKLSDERQGGALMISGYSIVSKLLENPSKYAELLASKCVNFALTVGSIDDESDFLSLLHVFETTTFGFAVLHPSGQNKISGTISVRDLLTLYQKEIVSSKLEVDDVKSSPVVELSKDAKLSEALHKMLRFKLRKLLITGTDTVITDTQILAHLFQESKMKLEESLPKRLKEGSIQKMELSRAPKIAKSTGLKEAAGKLQEKNVTCLLTDDGIVSPWDLIMKPWRLGELTVS
jgi:CBS domain-containing protein